MGILLAVGGRYDYIAAIEPFIDKPLVKILAGIRRCGKSTIFEMLREELLRRGIGEDQIVCKRYTEMDIPENITAKQMYDELTAASVPRRILATIRKPVGFPFLRTAACISST